MAHKNWFVQNGSLFNQVEIMSNSHNYFMFNIKSTEFNRSGALTNLQKLAEDRWKQTAMEKEESRKNKKSEKKESKRRCSTAADLEKQRERMRLLRKRRKVDAQKEMSSDFMCAKESSEHVSHAVVELDEKSPSDECKVDEVVLCEPENDEGSAVVVFDEGSPTIHNFCEDDRTELVTHEVLEEDKHTNSEDIGKVRLDMSDEVVVVSPELSKLVAMAEVVDVSVDSHVHVERSGERRSQRLIDQAVVSTSFIQYLAPLVRDEIISINWSGGSQWREDASCGDAT